MNGKAKEHRGGQLREKVMQVVFLIAACISILAVALICIYLFANGLPAGLQLIAEYDVQIAQTQTELEEAQAKEAEYYQLFCERFRDMEEQGLSLRSCGDVLLLGGEGHRTGKNKQGGNYEELARQGRLLYPGTREAARWSAQDCITTDKIPFIGQFAAERPDWFVATGFRKWGMSSAMVSAMLLRDRICGGDNPYAEVFAPARFSVEEIPQMVKDGGKAVKGLAKRFFHLPEETAAAPDLTAKGIC